MAKRTRRRNKRYSQKRNSKKKRVSKKRRVSKRVSKKTYKHKNMRGGMEAGDSNFARAIYLSKISELTKMGLNEEKAKNLLELAGGDLEMAKSFFISEPAPARASPPSGQSAFSFINVPPKPALEPAPAGASEPVLVEGSKIIYNILQSRGPDLLQYYPNLLKAGYDDTDIEDSDFLENLNESLQSIVPRGKGGHLARIIRAFKDHIGAAPSPAGAERGGLTAQQRQLAEQLMAQNLMAQNAINLTSRAGGYSAHVSAPAPGGFGAGAAASVVDSYIGYPGKNMCINCLQKPKRPPHQFCGRWCAGQLSGKKGRFMIAGGTTLGDLSDNPANYSYQGPGILNGKSPVPQGQPDYDKERYIYFYENDKNYKEFSNFHPCPSLVINGVQFPTSEHYFQCAKFKGSKFTECTQTFGEGARAVFNFARDNQSSVIDGWYGKSSFTGIFYPWWPDYKPNLKDLEMYKAVYHKFTQDEYLKHLLLFTGDKIIVEHAYPDDYWGDRNFQLRQKQWNLGDSENHLGQILMLVRMDINYNNQHLPDVIARQGILTM